MVGDRTWDVVIVDATDKPADRSLRLQAELLLRDLRVALEVVPRQGLGDLSPLTEARVSQAAYCVLITTMKEDDGREQTAYVGLPAPCYPGKSVDVAPFGTIAPPGSIETGRMGDVAALAGRIAERTRAG